MRITGKRDCLVLLHQAVPNHNVTYIGGLHHGYFGANNVNAK